jgi:hypothetical protein
MAPTVIIYGPPECGKTRRANAIARGYGIPETHIVDSWNDGCRGRRDRAKPLREGYLHLTNQSRDFLEQFRSPDVVIQAFEDLEFRRIPYSQGAAVVAKPNPNCTRCDGHGTKDHAGFAMDPCECLDPTASPAPSAVDSIVRDIARKCDDDVNGAIRRNMALVHGSRERAQVAIMACASALAAACVAFLAIIDELGGSATTAEEAAEALWDLMKPMTIRAIGDLQRAQATSHER